MSKSTVVLIHGSPGTGQSWRGVVETLGADWHAIAPTLHGYSGEPIAATDVSGQADHIIETLAAELLPDQIILAGHSFGGVVSLEIALRKELPVAAVVLFEPVLTTTLDMVGNDEAYAAVRDYFQNYIADFEGGNADAVEKMVAYWFGDDAFAAMPKEVQQYLRDMTAANVRDVKAAFDRRYKPAELGALDMPVTVAFGTASPHVVIDIANAVTSCVPRGLKHAIEGANHGMLAAHPAEVAAAIAKQALHLGDAAS